MRFVWIALIVGILMCAPLVIGCADAKKEQTSGGGMVTPPKNKNRHGVEHPPVPDPPP